jgi:hypothetical protein
VTPTPAESFLGIGGVTFRVACDDPRLAALRKAADHLNPSGGLSSAT